MLIVDKNIQFYFIFDEKEEKNIRIEPIVGQKIVI